MAVALGLTLATTCFVGICLGTIVRVAVGLILATICFVGVFVGALVGVGTLRTSEGVTVDTGVSVGRTAVADGLGSLVTAGCAVSVVVSGTGVKVSVGVAEAVAVSVGTATSFGYTK